MKRTKHRRVCVYICFSLSPFHDGFFFLILLLSSSSVYPPVSSAYTYAQRLLHNSIPLGSHPTPDESVYTCSDVAVFTTARAQHSNGGLQRSFSVCVCVRVKRRHKHVTHKACTFHISVHSIHLLGRTVATNARERTDPSFNRRPFKRRRVLRVLYTS